MPKSVYSDSKRLHHPDISRSSAGTNRAKLRPPSLFSLKLLLPSDTLAWTWAAVMNGILPKQNSGLDLLAKAEELSPFPTLWNPLDPLPEYTRSWGPHLRRPTRLPDEYDTRIDPTHIFVFSKHPITGIEKDFYVTPKSCEYCAKIRQVCSRSRPLCQRCACAATAVRTCTVEDGWVRLPGPKCKKFKLRVAKTAESECGASGSRSIPPRKARAIATTLQQDPGLNVRKRQSATHLPQVEPSKKKFRASQAKSTKAIAPLGDTTPLRRASTQAVVSHKRALQKHAMARSKRLSQKVASYKQELACELRREIPLA